ncbi:MAG: BPSL0067 family protein [Burkholderiaceae bacterium]|nr:BPSL0067 family protein [Burkholderiaceae bacterium]
MCRSATPVPGPIGIAAVAGEPGGARAAQPASELAETAATTYKLQIPESSVFGAGKFKNAKGNTECVEFVRQATGAPRTADWRRGLQVRLATQQQIERTTAIATFDDDGRYPTDSLGQHAAIYLSHDDQGVVVLDQWNSQGEVKERLIRFGRPKETSRSNNGDTFYVIEVHEQ